MRVQAQFDYIGNTNEYLSFRSGALIDVVRSNGGWSYGTVVRNATQEGSVASLDKNSVGWFPTSYALSYHASSSAALPNSTVMTHLTNSNFGAAGSPHTDEGDDDDGFFGTPMGGYIEPEESSNDNNTPRNADDDRDIEILPAGVSTVSVPDKRHRRIITIPKNLASNIATTTSKVTNRFHRRNQASSTTTTSPAVYVSP